VLPNICADGPLAPVRIDPCQILGPPMSMEENQASLKAKMSLCRLQRDVPPDLHMTSTYNNHQNKEEIWRT
jgi:hypothetical protein